MENNYMSNWYF